jgi:hypothetical protein
MESQMPPTLPRLSEDQIARLKQRIGFSGEPVQDAEGYWTIGYGRRLNDKPGGARPSATISEAMADEELRYRVEALAAMGRSDDTEMAHMALGEIVLPPVLQTRDVMQALSDAAARQGISLDRLRIGMPQNSINPNTGAAEFGTFSNRTFGGNTEGGYEDDDKVGGFGGGPIDEITIYGNGLESFVPNDMENFGRSIQQPGLGDIPAGGGGDVPGSDIPEIPIQANPVQEYLTPPKTGDTRMDARINTLHPLIRYNAAQAYIEARNLAQKTGHTLNIGNETFRTPEEQNKLYDKGLSNAKGGESYHNYGLALDLFGTKKTVPLIQTSIVPALLISSKGMASNGVGIGKERNMTRPILTANVELSIVSP